jgi:hypothetical protein
MHVIAVADWSVSQFLEELEYFYLLFIYFISSQQHPYRAKSMSTLADRPEMRTLLRRMLGFLDSEKNPID